MTGVALGLETAVRPVLTACYSFLVQVTRQRLRQAAPIASPPLLEIAHGAAAASEVSSNIARAVAADLAASEEIAYIIEAFTNSADDIQSDADADALRGRCRSRK